MGPLPPSSAAIRFLRYQFDNAAQLRRHCRQIDGRVFLFFPDAQPTPLPRSRALIEICFTGSTQQVALPAVVHSHELEGTSGAWLELRAHSMVAGLQAAAEVYARIEDLWAGARFARHQLSCECAKGSEALDPPAPLPVLTGGLQ